ncbi:hypothetical protein GGP41_007478 [Bipolaris sorokiniana]|uniref:Uncharacterized protein n=1 Tax=Cochliobolus sativus TaxID=45130 RepID=A0A8H5ZT16_COCSA|nr:hypothetical protein GGP41_007478 [Bipolaris sorokiniana]
MPFWPFCVGFGTSCEGRLSLAIASYYNNLKSSIYSLAKAYNRRIRSYVQLISANNKSKTGAVNISLLAGCFRCSRLSSLLQRQKARAANVHEMPHYRTYSDVMQN